MLEKRPDESVTEFTVRRMRAEFLEEAARIVEAEAVVPGEFPDDPIDVSYNTALERAAASIRRVARG